MKRFIMLLACAVCCAQTVRSLQSQVPASSRFSQVWQDADGIHLAVPPATNGFSFLHQIQRADTLTASNWLNVTNFYSDSSGQTNYYTESIGTNRSRFYRVQGLDYSSGHHVLINEVEVRGAVLTKDDFIELYNPSAVVIDISNWQLWRSSDQTPFNVLVYGFTNGASIAAHGYLLLVGSAYAGSGTPYDLIIGGGLPNTSFTYGLGLLDANSKSVDGLSYYNPADSGSRIAMFGQGSPVLVPAAGYSVSRFSETSDNSTDFRQTTPTPGTANQ